ncbi:ribosomal protein L36 [Tilletia horrida]|nr:ribosomal protein L36 [Tilletia horrida]
MTTARAVCETSAGGRAAGGVEIAFADESSMLPRVALAGRTLLSAAGPGMAGAAAAGAAAAAAVTAGAHSTLVHQRAPAAAARTTASDTYLAANRCLVWGINRGHQTTRRVVAPKPSYRKGRASQRSQTIKSVIREVAGFAPYERRAMELIRNSKDKRARKFVKKRLGTLRRAKAKMEILSSAIQEQRRAGH